MKIEKKKLRIGELAVQLGVERFVIRFWEKEFGIKGQRSDGGQRFYSEGDLAKFVTIKDLLYGQGFTIAGAKKHLKTITQSKSTQKRILASGVTQMESELVAPVQLEQPIGVATVDALSLDCANCSEEKNHVNHESSEHKEACSSKSELPEDLSSQIIELQKKLMKLRELL